MDIICPTNPDLDKHVGVVVHGVVVVVEHGRPLHGRLEDLVVGGGVPGHNVDVSVDDVLEVLDGVAPGARRHFCIYAGFRQRGSRLRFVNMILASRSKKSEVVKEPNQTSAIHLALSVSLQ